MRGPSVFKEYWGNPKATAEAFRDGWFLTGDVAVVEDGSYRLLGRSSVDIIKTGGYKVSALEIEEKLREHPAIDECAVVGLPDDEWGERVAAAAVLGENETLEIDELRTWCKERMAALQGAQPAADRRRAAAQRPGQGHQTGGRRAVRNSGALLGLGRRERPLDL